MWQLDEEWFSPGSTESVPSSYFPPEAFPAAGRDMISAYLWGVATPILDGYLGFVSAFTLRSKTGVHDRLGIGRGSTAALLPRPRSRFAAGPAFLALGIPTPLFWPVTVLIYRLYRHRHNTGAARAAANASS